MRLRNKITTKQLDLCAKMIGINSYAHFKAWARGIFGLKLEETVKYLASAEVKVAAKRRAMTSQSARLTKILDTVLEQGSAKVEQLEAALGVSAATIRRDLDRLANQQLVTRVRGGAVANPLSGDLPLRYRQANHGRVKQRLARAAAKLVQPGDIIGVNGGTTSTEVAREIALRVSTDSAFEHESLTLVTNAVNIANELVVRPQIKVIVVGGVVRPNSYEIVGNLSGVVLENLAMNRVFLGVVSIDSARGLFNDDLLEAEINADFLAAAARVTVVADSSKFTAVGVARISDFSLVDEIITDSVSAEDRAALAQHGVEVIEV
ncbi:transcriptional regulator, DeoR family [Mobiluncus mulieris 28-1]|nr:transcriptional regulator, DeoR family [Mobiluncus mulieris 28-1]